MLRNNVCVCQLIIIFGNFNVLANCHWSGQWLCLECWSERLMNPNFPQIVCRMIMNRPMKTNSSTVSSCVQVSRSASTQQKMDNMQQPDTFLLSTGVSACISAATESIVSEIFKVISSAAGRVKVSPRPDFSVHAWVFCPEGGQASSSVCC